MALTDKFVGKTLLSVLLLAGASVVTVVAWNYSLLGIFPTLPELKVGNVFVIYVATYLIKLLFTSPMLFTIQEQLSLIDTNMKNIHHNDTEQRKAIMAVLTHIEGNLRIAHGNDVSQRKGAIELLSIINNKLEGQKTETTHDVIE